MDRQSLMMIIIAGMVILMGLYGSERKNFYGKGAVFQWCIT